MKDTDYMKIALDLAKNGAGKVNPNPMVGAVIVKDGKIIGQGWHEKYGGLHAERNAFKNCRESPAGAVLYVTLEPCCHYGKTPPCTEAIIENGIKKVIIGAKDPNPLVAGKGAEILRRNGIEVVEGVLESECTKLNEVFFHYIKTGLPYVVMKYAMTMDGKIATSTGKSKWITGEAARKRVHEDRNRLSAIMVGIGTVLIDDPYLTCRIENGRNPIRIICDSKLRLPITSNIAKTAKDVPTIIATSSSYKEQYEKYGKLGIEVLCVKQKDGHLDLKELINILGKRGIDSLLIEGGGTLNYSALKEGIVNKIQVYIAPKIFGGERAKSPVGGEGVDIPDEAVLLKNSTVIKLGDDFLIESEVMPNVYGNC